MLRIGLTGGIASGKSTVADLFAAHGAIVLDADRIAREVVEPGTHGLAALVNSQGGGILDPEGRLDRAELRRRVFSDPQTRHEVEAILHPLIISEMQRQGDRATGAPYQVFVIPLLVEAGLEHIVDRVLVVDCPEEAQVSRLMARDGATHEQAMQALAAQASRERRLAAADDVIDNGGSAASLPAQVAPLDRKYRVLARQH
jgi:dephospho-CoA kinase